MNKEEKIKYSYELMVKNNPDEAVKQLIKQEKEIISYRTKIAKAQGSTAELIEYGDEWHWDDAAIRDYVIDIFNILGGEDSDKLGIIKVIDGEIYYDSHYCYWLYTQLEELQQLINEIKESCEEIESRSIDYTDTDYDSGQDSVARDILKKIRGEE